MLDGLLGVKAQGALVRSRFQSVEQMDGPTKFFLGLEKKNGQSRYIHSLYSINGTEITEPNEIRKRAVSFYSELYKSESPVVDESANSFYAGLPKVLDEVNSELQKPIPQENCRLHYRAWNVAGHLVWMVSPLTFISLFGQ